MKVTIVYDSRTGTTRSAALAMGSLFEEHGHSASVRPVAEADPREVAASVLICVGSWTQGLFVVLQHATKATIAFIDRLTDIGGKPAVVFCTYKLATGSMLPRMAAAFEAKGARVIGQFRFRGPTPDVGFRALVSGLAPESTAPVESR